MELLLIYNIILVSGGAQHGDSKFYRLYPTYSYYKIEAMVLMLFCSLEEMLSALHH